MAHATLKRGYAVKISYIVPERSMEIFRDCR